MSQLMDKSTNEKNLHKAKNDCISLIIWTIQLFSSPEYCTYIIMINMNASANKYGNCDATGVNVENNMKCNSHSSFKYSKATSWLYFMKIVILEFSFKDDMLQYWPMHTSLTSEQFDLIESIQNRAFQNICGFRDLKCKHLSLLCNLQYKHDSRMSICEHLFQHHQVVFIICWLCTPTLILLVTSPRWSLLNTNHSSICNMYLQYINWHH